MAELVDASVSNTDGAIRTGSIPVPGTWLQAENLRVSGLFFYGRLLLLCGMAGDYDEDVDDGLGQYAGDGCASDMV